MYSTGPYVFPVDSGQDALQVWPSAEKSTCEQNMYDPWQDLLAGSQYVFVPAYIAYGLLDTMAPLCYDTMAPIVSLGGKGCDSKNWPASHCDHAGSKTVKASKDGKQLLGPEQQEFHQEILRKLALHLAAQPDADQECQQQAQPPVVFEKSSSSKKDVESQGSSPRSVFCETPEDHSMPVWTDPRGRTAQSIAREEQPDEDTHCVWVPTYIAYGLLDAMMFGQCCPQGSQGNSDSKNRLGPQEQEFHQQMLRKLALHLAAQPDGDHESSIKGVQSQPFVQNRPSVPSNENCKETMPHKLRNWGSAGNQEKGAGRSLSLQQNPHQDEFHRQMLQKLALHLAAQPDTPKSVPMEAGQGQHVTWTARQTARGNQGKGTSLTSSHFQHSTQQQEFHQEMLRKLALHLAAQPQPLQEARQQADVSWEAADPVAAGEDKLLCERLVADLEPPADASRILDVLNWVFSVAGLLSLTQFGSRVVQKAIAVTSAQQRKAFAEILLPAAKELYTNPHGNHVLAKLMEVLPCARLLCIAEGMCGEATTVARHQFGSRILERLIEHCDEEQIGFLLDELLEDLEALARHAFGNFVVQRMFENCTAARKHSCVERLLPHVLQHATHKTASNVVQRMLQNVEFSWQAAMADAFLAGEGSTSLEAIAATRYGSFVVHQLVDRLHPRIDSVKARVKAAHPRLQESKFSQKNIVDFLGESFFHD
eukprot:TRINITY_DN24781_c0_g1_i1.p1 TRINITY_DN24781_c0_g1~~TRINITY_DN24781_c0_g1_i1.p1  ORF type:complete len:707 (+),score=133.21 TRINITY_DN24781_c0_g1_i1:209-2329(+)